MKENKFQLMCPVSNCNFYIKTNYDYPLSEEDKKSEDWKKIKKGFIQHLLEQHTPTQLVETIYDTLIWAEEFQASL